MSRYIDADKLVALCDEMSRVEWNKKVSPVSWADAYEGFIDDIDEQPTADVVEVVRCKDCVHWDREHIEMHTRSTEDSTLAEFAECERWSDWAKCRMLRYDDYCSCSERRSDDGT